MNSVSVAGERREWRWLWVTLFAVAFGTQVPTPLLLRYKAELGLSATTMTAIFGMYAAGLLPALLLAGPASDRHGRRVVAAPFVLLAAATSALFISAAASPPMLYVCRFLQGAVSGVVFSVGSAWLAELSSSARVAARRATVALSLGWALGPLSAGLLGQYGPAPTTLPYLVHLVLMTAGVAALVAVPETLTERRPAPLINIGVPPGAATAFVRFVVPVAVAVFTLATVPVTVLPLLLQRTLTGMDLAVTGVVAATTLIAGALVQPPARRLSAVQAGPAGTAVGALGLLVSLAASGLDAWLLLLPAALLLGAGYGLCLVAGLTVTELLAAPHARGALTASFYACAYLGFAAPLLLSVTAGSGGFGPPLAGLAALLAVGTAYLSTGPGRRAVQDAIQSRERETAGTPA